MGRTLSASGAALLLLLAIQATGLASGRTLRAAPHAEAPGPGPSTASDAGTDVSADVYNGMPAPAGVFDFMVRMKGWVRDDAGGYRATHMCGGALISPDTVLTAAHCLVLSDRSLVPLEALVLEVGGVAYEASSILVHPSYDPAALEAQNYDFSDGRVDSPLVPQYDIAAIKLATPVPNAPIVQLPTADLQLQPGQALEVAGWGRTGSSEDLPSSETLLYTPLEYAAPFDFSNQGAPGTCPLPSFTDCLCAVNTFNGANSCAGDSGGPLLVRDFTTGAATVVGVVSNGPPCGENPFGFYTSVATYLPEISAWMA